jgi:hypothetical protein
LNILDDGSQATFNDQTEYIPSPEVEKQIQKLKDAEKAQRARTWSFYEKLRKENPHLYRTTKTHEQMVQDAMALGDAFKDGDYDE